MQKVAITFLAIFAVGLIGASSHKKEVSPSVYSPIGKKDPFRAPSATEIERSPQSIGVLERFNLDQLQLKALIKTSSHSQAMFEDPEGKTHILNEGTVFGKEQAKISRILAKEVIVTVRGINYLGKETLTERVLSLPEDVEEEEMTGSLTTVVIPNKAGEAKK